uniref:Putative bovine pancreatic trypsin inhibitor n=1 Tax=Rhipicephalus microplus TaxID=6941 RepID=A0A6G5A7M7_RHIMP
MRLLLYPVLACLLICMIAGYEVEKNQEKPIWYPRHQSQRIRKGAPVGSRSSLKKNRGGHGGRHDRCTFRLERTNCVGASFVHRWTYNEDSNTCEDIHFPLCWNKSRMFLTCSACMNTCMKGTKKP